ncbi:MAG: hypothetical protein QOH90_1718 [Actinomycetota bacterium]|nr:hypothetical protein [Actinomycetota bacterium]
MLRRLILHPLLVAAYPVLFLFASNLTEDVKVDAVYRPLLFVLVVTAVVLALLWLPLRDLKKAALLTSIYVFLFFSYGHVHDALHDVPWVGSNGFLLSAWVVAIVAGTLAVVRTKKDLGGATAALNVVAAALVLLNVVPIVAHALEKQPPAPPPASHLTLPSAAEIPASSKRDIYYFIFDRYANDRTLRRFFHYDNSEVLDYLEAKGFYVAHDAAANHEKTAHSVASSLNMSYLNYLAKIYPPDSDEFRPIYQLLRGFQVSRYL